MGREELLRLGGVVELFDEEVGTAWCGRPVMRGDGGSIRKKRTHFAGAVIFDR